jgi:hypothetical protein
MHRVFKKRNLFHVPSSIRKMLKTQGYTTASCLQEVTLIPNRAWMPDLATITGRSLIPEAERPQQFPKPKLHGFEIPTRHLPTEICDGKEYLLLIYGSFFALLSFRESKLWTYFKLDYSGITQLVMRNFAQAFAPPPAPTTNAHVMLHCICPGHFCMPMPQWSRFAPSKHWHARARAFLDLTWAVRCLQYFTLTGALSKPPNGCQVYN